MGAGLDLGWLGKCWQFPKIDKMIVKAKVLLSLAKIVVTSISLFLGFS